MIPSHPKPSWLLGSKVTSHRIQCRSFSTSRATAALSQAGRTGDVIPRQRPQLSIKGEKKKQMGSALDSMTEFGLLPDTIVWPSRANLPSFSSAPRLRLRLARKRFWDRMGDIASRIYYKFFLKKQPWKRPWPRLHMRALPRTAAALHTRMYTAFAEGDSATIHTICCSSLARSFASRIAARPPSHKLVWRRHALTSRPRVVSHRAAKLPMDVDGGHEQEWSLAIRQAVVRVESVQSLESWKRARGRDERVSEVRMDEQGKGKMGEKKMMEYLVLQQRLWWGKQEDWMVWGTVEESSLAEALGESGEEARGKAMGKVPV